MKPDQIYHNLKEVAEKLCITVKEQNVRNVGIHVSSGLCRIKDDQVFIMDKRLSVREKTLVLAECLGAMNIDDVYIVPAVRALLDKHKTVSADKNDDKNDADNISAANITNDNNGEEPTISA